MVEGEYRRLACQSCAASFTGPNTPGRPRAKCDNCLRSCRLCKKPLGYQAKRWGAMCAECISASRKRAYPQAVATRRAKDPTSKLCKGCGGHFKTRTGSQTFCSKRCVWTAKNRRSGTLPKAEYLAKAKNQIYSFECEWCKKATHRAISPTNRKAGFTNRWCSMSCRVEWHADRRPPAKERAPCIICSTLCDRVGARYCSEACRTRWQLIDYYGCKTPIRCLACDTEYCRVPGAWNRGLCSDECTEAHYAAVGLTAGLRRRSRIYAGERDRIDPIRVLERDKWRCHLCGVKTPKSLRGTMDDRAPEMDHIVAIADGGTHTWGNVACACKRCNRIKGASSKGQLGLAFAA